MATPQPPPIPDRPPVPRTKFGTFAIVLAIFGVLVTGGYAYASITDYEYGTPERDQIPASVRSSPGGYRSYHTWHSGYHGGK
jgi:hypothetical protein